MEMAYGFIALTGIFLLTFPILLFILEFFLCKNNSKMAKILPIIVACSFLIFGFYSLIIAGIMYGIYFIMKRKQDKITELDKMNIQDL